MSKRVRTLLAVVLAGILVVSGGFIAWKMLDYRKGAQDYSEAASVAGLNRPAAQTPAVQPEGEEEEEPEPYDPFEALAAIDLEALRAVNSDVVGWIEIPDTEVSYPVLQTSNNSYYLNHTWKKENSSVGAIFMETTNDPGLEDFHTIVYGHNMRNGSMFGGLRSYRNRDYWEAHPAVYLADDTGVHQYDIFAAYEVGVREIIYRLDIEENNWQGRFLDYALRHTVIDTGIVPSEDGHILTLSTCTGSGHATRWIIQAVRAEEPEPETPAEEPQQP